MTLCLHERYPRCQLLWLTLKMARYIWVQLVLNQSLCHFPWSKINKQLQLCMHSSFFSFFVVKKYYKIKPEFFIKCTRINDYWCSRHLQKSVSLLGIHVICVLINDTSNILLLMEGCFVHLNVSYIFIISWSSVIHFIVQNCLSKVKVFMQQDTSL